MIVQPTAETSNGARPGSCVVLAHIVVSLSCSPPTPNVLSPPFEEVFDLLEIVELDEHPSDSTAEIGVFLERRDGGFLIADGLLPRVRRYSADGALLSAFGRFGSGPWELRDIRGVAETESGQVVVSSPRSRWLTYLNADLNPDTLVPVEFLVSEIHAMGPDMVFHGFGPLTGETYTGSELDEQQAFYHKLADGRVEWSRWDPQVFDIDKPYWRSFYRPLATVASDSLVVMTSLFYPATVFDRAGDSVGTIGTPSSSFRRIPEVPRGYFGTDQTGPRMARFLASFDFVARIDAVGRGHLVFTIAHFDESKPTFPYRELDSHVEIYDLAADEKLFADVRLPENARVLAGGRYLYVLLNRDFPPWRIAKYRLSKLV